MYLFEQISSIEYYTKMAQIAFLKLPTNSNPQAIWSVKFYAIYFTICINVC